jgi:hypothetical protein
VISRDLCAARQTNRARFDVDPADLVFARARETNKGVSKTAVLRKGAAEAHGD